MNGALVVNRVFADVVNLRRGREMGPNLIGLVSSKEEENILVDGDTQDGGHVKQRGRLELCCDS